MSPELSSYEQAQLRRAGIDLRDREAVEEHILWLESILDEIRWPIEDDGYLESLDTTLSALAAESAEGRVGDVSIERVA